MSANLLAPGAQAKRFAAYLDRLAHAAGHLDRAIPLKSYCTGLLLPGERKSVEPMAARLCPEKVRQTHQSLHHLVADAPWSDEDLLEAVRHHGAGIALRAGNHVLGDGVETGPGTSAQAGLERDRTSAEISAAGSAACSAFGESPGLGAARWGMEESVLARRYPRPAPFPLRGAAGSPGAPRLRAQPTLPPGMAAGGMAEPGSGADQVLAVHSDLPTLRCGTWCEGRSSAGSSNAIMKS